MEQETISRIALLASVLGLAMLVVMADLFEPRPVKISEIDETLAGWPVKVNAKIHSYYEKDNVAFLQLYDGTGKIKAVLFRPSEEQRQAIGKNKFASFEGKIKIYREELEIVVEGIEEWG